MITKNSRIYVAGHKGLVGSSILKVLKEKGFKNIYFKTSKELDLRNQGKVFNYIKNDSTIFESDVLEQIASKNELTSYKHNGFWECMDTIKDRNNLNNLWNNDKALWKKW